MLREYHNLSLGPGASLWQWVNQGENPLDGGCIPHFLTTAVATQTQIPPYFRKYYIAIYSALFFGNQIIFGYQIDNF